MKRWVCLLSYLCSVSLWANGDEKQIFYKKENLKKVVSELKSQKRKVFNLEFLKADTGSLILLHEENSQRERWEVEVDLLPKEFSARRDYYSSQGYTIEDFEAYEIGGFAHYAVLWKKERSRNTSASGRKNLFIGEARLLAKKLRRKGLVPTDVEGYKFGVRQKYSLGWKKNTHRVKWKVNWDVKSEKLDQVTKTMEEKGFVLKDIEAYPMRGKIYWTLLWHKERVWPRPWFTDYKLDKKGLLSTQEQITEFGFKLKSISAFEEKGVTYFSALWEG